METISISQFKARCLAVMADVKRTGRPILVTKRGEPIAEVVPARSMERKRRLGCMAGTFEIVGDISGPAIDPKEWNAIGHPERVLDPNIDRRRKRRK